MRAVERHGGKRIALGPRRAAQGPPRRAAQRQSPGRSRVPGLEAVEAWVEDVKANREQLHTLGDLTIISVPAI